MKLIKILSIVLVSFLICNNVMALEVSNAKKYLGKDVFLVKGDTVVPCGLYGRVVDVLLIREEWYIVLDTNYSYRYKLMWFSLKNIDYIRERRNYE